MEAYQLHLHQYRSPRTKEPLVVSTQIAHLGCVRRFFAWLCHRQENQPCLLPRIRMPSEFSIICLSLYHLEMRNPTLFKVSGTNNEGRRPGRGRWDFQEDNAAKDV